MAVETLAMYNDQQLGSVANQVKEITVAALLEQGVIDKVAADLFLEQYAIVIVTKGWLGTAIDKVLNFKKPDDKKFQLMKIS